MYSEELIKKKLEIAKHSAELLEKIAWKNKQLSYAERLMSNEKLTFRISVNNENGYSFHAGESREVLKMIVDSMTKERDGLLEEINKLILIAQ